MSSGSEKSKPQIVIPAGTRVESKAFASPRKEHATTHKKPFGFSFNVREYLLYTTHHEDAMNLLWKTRLF